MCVGVLGAGIRSGRVVAVVAVLNAIAGLDSKEAMHSMSPSYFCVRDRGFRNELLDLDL